MKKNYRYDSRYQSKKKQNFQEICEHILNMNYGETLPMATAAQILQYNIEDEQEKKKFMSTMARVKHVLVEFGYVVKTITEVGFYILKPQHISSYCYHSYIQRSLRILEKSDYVLQHVDTSNLSEVRGLELSQMRHLNKELQVGMGSAINASEYKQNKNKYDSIKD